METVSQEDVDRWINQVLDSPSNIASKQELMEQLSSAVNAFRGADKDASGTLTIDEMKDLCSFMGMPVTDDEEEWLYKMDADRSGTLEMEEWVLWWLGRVSCVVSPAKQQEAIARNAFRKYDQDGSGGLDSSEIEPLLRTLGARFGPSELNEVLRILDSDNNGTVNEDEFVSWWTNRSSNARKEGGLIALKLKRLAAKASLLFSTDIFTACWKKNADLVKAFLDADPRCANSSDCSDWGAGWTPLHYAAYQGAADIVELLLASRAGVNRTNKAGFSPIFYAAQQDHVQVCELLIGAGADPTVCGCDEKATSRCTIGIATPPELMHLCAIDFAVENPALRTLFKAHAKCTAAPARIPESATSATLSRAGMLSVQLPPVKAISTVPIRTYKIRLVIVNGDVDWTPSSTGAEAASPLQAPESAKTSREKASLRAEKRIEDAKQAAAAASRSKVLAAKKDSLGKTVSKGKRACNLVVVPDGASSTSMQCSVDPLWFESLQRAIKGAAQASTSSSMLGSVSVTMGIVAVDAFGDSGPESNEIVVTIPTFTRAIATIGPDVAEAGGHIDMDEAVADTPDQDRDIDIIDI